MKHLFLIGIILLSTIAGTNTMEDKPNIEKEPKSKHHIKLRGVSQGSSTLPKPIKLRGVSQGNSTLPKPIDTPHKRPSPNTDKALEDARKKEEIPYRLPSPRMTKNEEKK